MKKNIVLLLIISWITLPAFAITDVNPELQKAEIKYQQKLEKIKRKQEIKCLKHPEICTPAQSTNLTLGVAQKNIKIGTSQDEVTMTLGSPNIVTTDSNGLETWIYDKVSSVTSYNNSGFNVGALGGGGGAGLAGNGLGGGGGLLGVGYARNKSFAQSSQKTLTIVIKFSNKKVSSFQYHMSNF